MALILAVTPGAASAGPGWVELPVETLQTGDGREVATGPGGSAVVSFLVDARRHVLLPLPGVQELELDYQVDGGPLLLTWCAATDGQYEPFGWYWRHQPLQPGRGRVRLDMRITSRYRPDSTPLLVLHGNGRITFTGLRVLGPEATAEAHWAAIDSARRLAPESFGHITFNSLAPSMWSVSRGANLHERLGAAFVALAATGLLGAWAVRRRWRPGAPLLAAVVVAVALSDLHAAWKLAPPWRLAPHLDPEARLRDGYPFAPEAAALAVAARAAIPAGASVMVLSAGGDWFSPRVLCFQLAPRRCVIAHGQEPAAGLSGVDQLGDLEVGAVVSINAGTEPPPGFAAVARTSPRGFVALRP
jgi:hypothetical protein